MTFLRRFFWGAAVLSAFLWPSRSEAALGVISTTFDTAGPLNINDTFVVSLSISGFDAGTAPPPAGSEIDAYQFVVTYPVATFSFVGPFDHGTTTPGPNQQWLAKANQEATADGYSPTPLSDGTTPGTIVVDLSDLGFSVVEGGTVAASGFLVSFTMQAIGAGTGIFTPAAPPGGVVFFDSNLTPIVGSPGFAPGTIEVVPEPAAGLFAVLGALSAVLRRRRNA